MIKNRIYMGWDVREKIAYDVAKFSILRRTDERLLDVVAVDLLQIKRMYTRPITRDGEQLWDDISGAPMSTEFAISRFFVPQLARRGWTAFMDSDVVALSDVRELFDLADPRYAVMVVKHNHIPSESEKYHDGGMIQTVYPRKNWSSVILFNCDHPSNEKLTLEVLNSWRGLDLHGFKWLKDEEIGELPQSWNFLVDVNEGVLEDQHLLHYTNGQPGWGQKWIPKPSDRIWNKEYVSMIYQQKYSFI